MDDLKEIFLYFRSKRKFYLLPITLSFLIFKFLFQRKILITTITLFVLMIGLFISKKESNNNQELSSKRYQIHYKELLI